MRIRERDGRHSRDGDPESINAWVRVYEEDARAAAARADDRLSHEGVRRDGPAPALCGVPIGLKDLYAVAGKPLTASSRLLEDVPAKSSEVWTRLEAAGMVLLGHLHTHEFAAGGTTDQVGNPWALDRSAGGSSGGSAAALAARMVPAATGTDTAGSLRIPSALCATSTIKPTHGLVSIAGIVPLATTLDHAGPMARTLEDCAMLLAAMADSQPHVVARGRLDGVRLALSPRLSTVSLDPDVADGLETALDLARQLGATLVEPPPPAAALDLGEDFGDVLFAEMLAFHRRFDDRRERYRPALRQFLEEAERRATSPEAYAAVQGRRRELTTAWTDWLATERIAALVEPTVPVVAPVRGPGFDDAWSDVALISLTHYWDWTGFPAVAFPAAIGPRSGLPVSVSLVGPAGSDGELLAFATALQAQLGVPDPGRPPA